MKLILQKFIRFKSFKVEVMHPDDPSWLLSRLTNHKFHLILIKKFFQASLFSHIDNELPSIIPIILFFSNPIVSKKILNLKSLNFNVKRPIFQKRNIKNRRWIYNSYNLHHKKIVQEFCLNFFFFWH